MSVSQDVQEFMELIESWSDLSKDWNKVNTKKLNRLHDQYHSIFKSLKSLNRLEELEPFLYHTDKTVCNVIATYYLVQNEDLAIKRLEELSKESGLVGLGSKSNLDSWRKGELNFDY